MTKKRIGIYLLFSFGIVWGMTIIYLLAGGTYEDSAMDFILSMSMLAPAISVVITRKLTKEGFQMTGKGSLMLGIDLKNKKWIWFVVALILPILYFNMGVGLYYIIFPKAFDASLLKELGLSTGQLFLLPLFGICMAFLISFGALGEEIGWRGYLYPKLEELYGSGKAMIFGGIIWGVWHFPAIYAGHNFGHGYWGEPYTGFFVFVIYTIAIGILLQFVTKKTGSVWAPAFMHAVNNAAAGSSVLWFAYNDKNLTGIALESTVRLLIIAVPSILLAIVAWVAMKKEKTDNLR